jgi:preprotein translocase subunit YajC
MDLITGFMPPAGDGGQGGSPVMLIVMMVGMFAIMYFLIIRPQQKRQKEHKAMLEAIKKSDKVVTSSGIHGTVVDLDGTTMTLQIAENVKVKFDKAAIVSKQQ